MKLLTVCRAAACVLLLLPVAGSKQSQPTHPDHPNIAPGAFMQDVTFHSAALNRDMPYRVFLPALIKPGERLPVVYLLHGGDGSFRDWSNDSTVSLYAAKGLILVMPEGEFSYYMNAAGNPSARFEDYTFHDLIADVESRFPVAATQDKRAIIGISMGGFAAIRIALTRPDLFAFVGAFSPPIDITHRHFHPRRWGRVVASSNYLWTVWQRDKKRARSADARSVDRPSKDSLYLFDRRRT